MGVAWRQAHWMHMSAVFGQCLVGSPPCQRTDLPHVAVAPGAPRPRRTLGPRTTRSSRSAKRGGGAAAYMCVVIAPQEEGRAPALRCLCHRPAAEEEVQEMEEFFLTSPLQPCALPPRQVVVLSHILACGATTGYESTMGECLGLVASVWVGTRVQGQEVSCCMSVGGCGDLVCRTLHHTCACTSPQLNAAVPCSRQLSILMRRQPPCFNSNMPPLRTPQHYYLHMYAHPNTPHATTPCARAHQSHMHTRACVAGIKDAPVVRFNGTPVRNLAHLVRLVMDCGDPFLRFDLESGNKVWSGVACVGGVVWVGKGGGGALLQGWGGVGGHANMPLMTALA